jgi:hypothetical protein
MFAFGSTSNFHVFEIIDTEKANNSDDEEEKTQERLAKRFAKRARMQRLEESHAESEEFSQQRLIDEDETMKLELKKMKVGTSFSLFHLSRFIATILTHMLIFSEWPCSKEKRFLGFQKLLLFSKRVVPTGFISIQAPAQYWKFWRVLLSNGGRQPLPCLADESREEQD